MLRVAVPEFNKDSGKSISEVDISNIAKECKDKAQQELKQLRSKVYAYDRRKTPAPSDFVDCYAELDAQLLAIASVYKELSQTTRRRC